jgi:hypothetical protein
MLGGAALSIAALLGFGGPKRLVLAVGLGGALVIDGRVRLNVTSNHESLGASFSTRVRGRQVGPMV